MSDAEAREVYAAARLGQNVTLGSRPAVLVVDFSCGFTDPECTLGSDLTPQEEETIVLKKGASAFFGTNLASILISQQVDSVILCGATTSGCIRATAIDLLQYGFPTLVPRECVGDRAQAPHEANLFDIQAKYADVVSLEDALAYVEGVRGKVGAPA